MSVETPTRTAPQGVESTAVSADDLWHLVPDEDAPLPMRAYCGYEVSRLMSNHPADDACSTCLRKCAQEYGLTELEVLERVV